VNLEEAPQFLKDRGWLLADHRHFDVWECRRFTRCAWLWVVRVNAYATVNFDARLPTNIGASPAVLAKLYRDLALQTIANLGRKTSERRSPRGVAECRICSMDDHRCGCA
jgi:hypothetical protein